MAGGRPILALGLLLATLTGGAAAQETAPQPDSAQAQIRAVLRAFYLHMQTQNWEALSAYVLSPKLLERRGAPGDLQMVARDRARGRGSSHERAAPIACAASSRPDAASSPPHIDEAAIQVDGDWAEVSVPRCRGASSGADEFRMLYFEQRWRFIYTELFEAPPPSSGR